MEKKQRQRSLFHIRFPVEKGVRLDPVVNTLKWWNSHYKAMHEWEGGRVEIKFDRRVKGYDHPKCKSLDFSCPYCEKRLYYTPASVHNVKGHICCGHCRKQFGVNPNGQVFVVRTVSNKVATETVLKDRVIKWASNNTTYLNAHIYASREGDDGVEVEMDCFERKGPHDLDEELKEFVQLLDESGFEYRRLT